MTRLRDMFATAQEVAALRDRAISDAAEIAALRRRVAGFVARCDQTDAENRDLNNQVVVLARALISLGVAVVESRDGQITITRDEAGK